jgi:hypothetical protein
MSWYVANALLFCRFKDGVQDVVPVWENMYLIEAESAEHAMQRARDRAKEDEGDSEGSLLYNDRPCELVFAGVRKVTACENESERPSNGTEVTYNELLLDSMALLDNLARGEPVQVVYEAMLHDEQQ